MERNTVCGMINFLVNFETRENFTFDIFDVRMKPGMELTGLALTLL